MEDLLSRHADAVAGANAEHRAELRDAIAKTDAAMRDRIAACGAKALEALRAVDAARETLAAELSAIADTLAEQQALASAGNLAAIGGSASDFEHQLSARLAFLRGGELPAADAPPPAPAAADEAETAQPDMPAEVADAEAA